MVSGKDRDGKKGRNVTGREFQLEAEQRLLTVMAGLHQNVSNPLTCLKWLGWQILLICVLL